MSRLELGPEGNPNYVIDENASGELEVRDSDGNAIATYKQDQTSEFQSVATEEIYNDEEPNLDISELAHLARTGGGIHYQPANTIDGYQQQTNGGTSINQLTDRQTADTGGSNSGAACGFDDPAQFVTLGAETWDKDRTVVMKVGWNRADANYIRFFNGGRSTSSPPAWRIGIIVKNGDLLGWTAEGGNGSGSENTTTLISNVGTSGTFSVRMELTAGEKVEWYINGTKEGETTNSIPTGDGNSSDHGIGAAASTPDSNAAIAAFYGGMVVQHP